MSVILVDEFPHHHQSPTTTTATQPKVFTCAAAVFNWFCQTEDSWGQTGGWTPRLYLCRAYGLRSKRAGLSSVQIRNLPGSAQGCTKIAQISPIPKSKQAGLSSVRIGNLLTCALGWTKNCRSISDHFDLLVCFGSIISNTPPKTQASLSSVHIINLLTSAQGCTKYPLTHVWFYDIYSTPLPKSKQVRLSRLQCPHCKPARSDRHSLLHNDHGGWLDVENKTEIMKEILVESLHSFLYDLFSGRT